MTTPSPRNFDPDRPRVFLSYARSDGEAFTRDIRARLERDAPGLKLWRDREAMEGGVGWWRQITEALDVVEVILLVLTPAAIKSEVVTREWRYARQRGVHVYPVHGWPGVEIDFGTMPKWMGKAHAHHHEKEWAGLLDHLKHPGLVKRVPYMADDLPRRFVERPNEFSRIRTLLLQDQTHDPVASTVALHGAGGFGKTTLALALCHDEEIISAFDDGILWVTLGERPNLIAALGKLYTALTGEDREDFRDVEDARQHLAERLKDRACLVVLDDVWHPDHLQPFLRSSSQCAWLITTRQFEVAAEAESVTVEEMTADQAIDLLTARLDPQPTSGDLASFHELARRLNAWPLLLELAGAALNREIKRGLRLDRAVAYVSRELGNKGVTAFDPRNAEDRRRSVTGTIEVSLEHLPETDRRRLAELTIFPQGLYIPLTAAASLWGLSDEDAENQIRTLHDLSLLKPDRDFQAVRIHDVLRIYLAGRLNDSERQACHARLIDAWGDPFRLGENLFAWRWIGYHLIAAGRPEVLRALLLEPAWIEAKLQATSPSALSDDYARISPDADLAQIEKAIRLSTHVLVRDMSQFHSQLTGRLLAFGSPAIKEFLDRLSRSRRQPWLRPQSPCLTPPGGPLVRILEGHQGHVRGVAVTSDGRRLLSASDDKTVRVWSLETGMVLRILEGHEEAVLAVALISDSGRAISASHDKTLKVWDLATGVVLRTLEGHQDAVNAVAITPDGDLAVSGSKDQTLKIWDLATGVVQRTLEGHGGDVNAVAVTPDGLLAVSGSEDQTLKIWDLATGVVQRTLKGHTFWVDNLALTPDSRCVLFISHHTALVWDLDTGAVLHTPGGPEGSWRPVAITPDGRRFILGSSFSNTIQVWDFERQAVLMSFTADAAIGACAMVANGLSIVVGDHEGRVYCLQIEEP